MSLFATYNQKFYSVTWSDPVTGTVYFYNHNPVKVDGSELIPPKILAVNTETMEYSFYESMDIARITPTLYSPAWILAAHQNTIKDSQLIPFSYQIYFGASNGIFTTETAANPTFPVSTTCGSTRWRKFASGNTADGSLIANMGTNSTRPAYIETEIFSLNKNVESHYSDIASKGNILSIRPSLKTINNNIDLSGYGMTIKLYTSDKIQDKSGFAGTLFNGSSTPTGYIYTAPTGKISAKYFYIRCDIPLLSSGNSILAFFGFNIQWDDSGNK